MSKAASRLPPLNAIRAFEAAARLGSFARAAAELAVTDSAISKQVAALEMSVGRKLFERGGSGVALTLEGRELAQAVIPAFAGLAAGFDRYGASPRHTPDIRITTVASFAALCLVPALPDLHRRHPDVAVEIRTADRLVDMASEDYDLAIRFGEGRWHGLVETPLTAPELVPVCRATSANQERDPASLLSRSTRIRCLSEDEWTPLLQRVDSTTKNDRPELYLEHFLVAREAVLTGAGLALLPRVLVAADIAAGRLWQFERPVPCKQRFFLANRPEIEHQKTFGVVRDWVIASSRFDVA